jgi:hypothetical protein
LPTTVAYMTLDSKTQRRSGLTARSPSAGPARRCFSSPTRPGTGPRQLPPCHLDPRRTAHARRRRGVRHRRLP